MTDRTQLRTLRRALCLSLCLIPGIVHAADGRRKVILDDEAFGLAHVMLLEAPDVEVLGITTESGDVWVNRGTALALRGLE